MSDARHKAEGVVHYLDEYLRALEAPSAPPERVKFARAFLVLALEMALEGSAKSSEQRLTTEDLDLLQFGRVLHKRPEQGEKG